MDGALEHDYNLRQRKSTSQAKPVLPSTVEPVSHAQPNPHHPTTHTINLSLPPYERYVELARCYREQLQATTPLFDTTLTSFVPFPPVYICKALTRMFLRKLYSDEETLELKGIADTAGIDLFYLIALNSGLDAMMGCTSGGVRVRPDKGERGEGDGQMYHFRTLDWAMDELRPLVVMLNFVQEEGGEVVARSISYAGFVGVLTGVRFALAILFHIANSSCHPLPFSENIRDAQLIHGSEKETTLRIAKLSPYP